MESNRGRGRSAPAVRITGVSHRVAAAAHWQTRRKFARDFIAAWDVVMNLDRFDRG
jgi:catalase (peroxidase I)